jgi:hypothetical protein
VVLVQRALAHQRGLHRDLQIFGQLQEFLVGLTEDHAATGQQQRPLGGEQHVQRTLDPGHVRLHPEHRQRRVQGGVPLDLLLLDVQRQVDEHRPGPAGLGDPERLAEDPRRLRGLLDLHRPLGDRLGDLHDVDGLEGFLVQLGRHRLAGDADHRDGVGQRGVQTGDHVRARGTGRADGDTDLAVGARPAVGHVGRALLVPHDQVLDPADYLKRLVQRQNRGAWAAERGVDALGLEDLDDRLHCGDLRHRMPAFLNKTAGGQQC